MSSHREAPQTSQDPVADNTDVYAFVSPDAPDTVTIIANYVPLEAPAGGPNFYAFGDDVLYEIVISNSGKQADIIYQFHFTTTVADPAVFLYNTGPITSLSDSTWNNKQSYDVSVVKGSAAAKKLGSGLACPPCNIGPLSTPNYPSLATAAVHTLATGEKVFAGQRGEAFFVDLGAVFDLADLRPFANLHAGSSLGMSSGVNTLASSNVHTIALQIPKTMLTVDGSNPTKAASPKSVIGVYASAKRQKTRVYNHAQGIIGNSGPYTQVSRLGMPLFNEVLVGLGQKDLWNSADPFSDSQFAANVAFPGLAALLPTLYPNVFPHLAALNAKLKAKPPAKQRADLLAIFLTGIPTGIVPGFQNNTGTTQADLLRLNMAIPPSTSPNPAGLVAGDAAGFPNGRRLEDDIVTIELRALAGVTYALVDKTYTPDAAAAKVTDGATGAGINLLSSFPYMPTPYDGYYTPSATSSGATTGGGPSAAASSTSSGPTPSGAPQTGGGGAAGLGDRTPLTVGAAALGAAGAASAIAAGRHLTKRVPAGAGGPNGASHANGASPPALGSARPAQPDDNTGPHPETEG